MMRVAYLLILIAIAVMVPLALDLSGRTAILFVFVGFPAMALAIGPLAGGVIAVVDEGGNLMALERLDGTFAAGANISIGKAAKTEYCNCDACFQANLQHVSSPEKYDRRIRCACAKPPDEQARRSMPRQRNSRNSSSNPGS